MKNKLTTLAKSLFIAAAVAFSAGALQSCEKKDPCNDSCVNGYCAEGDCVCETGYTGKWCATYTGKPGPGPGPGPGPDPDPDPTPTSYTAMFWSNFSGSPISVYINGSYAGSITQYYSSTTPSCGATGCVTKTYSGPTSLSYTAEDDDHSWNGTLSVTSGCNRMCLTL